MEQRDITSKSAKYLSWIVAAILILLPFHALLTTWLGSNTGHLDLIRIWKEILITVIAVPAAWLFLRSQRHIDWLRNSLLPQLILLYFLINFVLGIWALKHDKVNTTALIYALIINLRFLGFFAVCYVLAGYNAFLKRHWRPILLWPAALVIAFGLVQLLLPTDFLKHFGYGPKTIPAYQTVDSDINYQRIQSTLRGANPLGAYLILIIPALLFIKNRLIKLASLATALIVLFFSYSRSAWLGVAATAGLILLFRAGASRRLKEIVTVGLGVLILTGLAVFVLRTNTTAQDTLFHTSSSSTNVSSNSKRLQAMEDGAKDVVNEPLGRGPGTAGPASFRNTGHTPRIAENYFLQIAQEVGVAGLLVFLGVNWLVAAQLWARRQEPLAQILLASLAGITLVNLVSHAWTDDTLSLLWWGLAGITCGSAILTTSTNHKNAKTQKKAA